MATRNGDNSMDRIFGGPVVATLLKLALLSLAVGLVFAAFGIDPMDLWRDFGATIRQAWTLALDAVSWSWPYAALGAIVVLPLWILYRLVLAISGRSRG
jgi:hypothetical protein